MVPITRLGLATVFASLCIFLSTSNAAVWDGGGGVDQNWSTVTNWNDDSDPAGQDITFTDTAEAGAAGVVTNIVDTSYSVGNFVMTNIAGDATPSFHTTRIDAGQTLTITGNYEQGVSPCSFGGACTGDDTHMTFTGDGTLAFNNSSGRFEVGQWSGRFDRGARQVTLDMSGLANFTMDANVWEIGRVGAANPATVMTLADTNNITATTLDIAEWNDTGVLELGRQNTLNIDTFQISYSSNNSASATIRFDTGLVDPSVTIRNRAGTGGATLNMSENNGGGGSNPANLDLSGGDVDALFDSITMSLGRPNQHSGNAIATITFDQGTMEASTVLMGRVREGGNTTSTINVNGTGTFEADTITMVDVTDSNGNGLTGTGTSRINVNGGTVRAITIQPGILQGDVVKSHVREINLASGTIGNRTGNDMFIDTNIAINLTTAGSNDKFFNVETGQVATVDGVISGAGGFTKTGDGTLLLEGANTFTGDLVVAGGILGGNGSLSGALLAEAGSTIAPGTSPGILSADSVSFDSLSTYSVEVGGTTAGLDFDQLQITTEAALAGTLEITLTEDFNPSINDTFVIVDAGSITGQFDSVSVLNSNGYFDISYIGGQAILSNFQVPEPNTGLLLGLGIIGGSIHRRRRNNTRV